MAFYEKGQRRVLVNLLPNMARLLNVSVEELLRLDNVATKRGPTLKLQRQLERLSRLSRSRQRFVLEILETVLQQASR